MTTASLLAAVLLAAVPGAALADGAEFRISLDPALGAGPVNGRLVVSVIRPGSSVPPDEDPNNAPFWGHDEPLFGADVSGLSPDNAATVGAGADHNLEAADALRPGTYRAAVRLITMRQTSSWRRDAGNLFSDPVVFTVEPGKTATVNITLAHATEARRWPIGDRAGDAELVEVRSRLLSEFHHRDITLRAGVVKPVNFDPARRYAAVYEVPGFGGDQFDAISIARRRRPESSRVDMGDEARLAGAVFWIVLDPESENGHTLFADSANNGPRARALVEELIPELEKRYPLEARPEARLLRGHSSGGWSTLWLALTHPETFGATWSTSPDPVDFRRFQLIDIYDQRRMYRAGGMGVGEHLARLRQTPGAMLLGRIPDVGDDIASFRHGDRAVMSVRQEACAEDILGPDNTSGQQWDSWFAVWGPRNSAGHPAALFDPVTGEIDRAVAEQYRAYDIGDRLRKEPGKYAPLLRERVRLVVGDADNFFLNEAVALLKADLDAVKDPPPGTAAEQKGYITIVPGRDHGSVFQCPEVRAFPGQMLEHLERHGLLHAGPAPTPPK